MTIITFTIFTILIPGTLTFFSIDFQWIHHFFFFFFFNSCFFIIVIHDNFVFVNQNQGFSFVSNSCIWSSQKSLFVFSNQTSLSNRYGFVKKNSEKMKYELVESRYLQKFAEKVPKINKKKTILSSTILI